jgi:outer membrane protein
MKPSPLARPLAAALVLALACALTAPARAADAKIGFIDSSKLFQQYKLAKEAQERFDRQVQSWRDEAAEKDNAVKKLRDEVKDQAPILSSLKRQEREEALQKAIADYEAFIQEIWGPSGRAAQENERSTREIIDQIRAVVEKIAAARGFDMVLDAAGGSIIYAARDLDLSAAVLDELNTNVTGTGR